MPAASGADAGVAAVREISPTQVAALLAASAAYSAQKAAAIDVDEARAAVKGTVPPGAGTAGAPAAELAALQAAVAALEARTREHEAARRRVEAAVDEPPRSSPSPEPGSGGGAASGPTTRPRSNAIGGAVVPLALGSAAASGLRPAPAAALPAKLAAADAARGEVHASQQAVARATDSLARVTSTTPPSNLPGSGGAAGVTEQPVIGGHRRSGGPGDDAHDAADAASEAAKQAESSLAQTNETLEDAQDTLERAQATLRKAEASLAQATTASKQADAELAESYAALERAKTAGPAIGGAVAVAGLPRAVATKRDNSAITLVGEDRTPTLQRQMSAADRPVAAAAQTTVQKQLAAARARHSERARRSTAHEAASDVTAAQFDVDDARKHPGQVSRSVLASSAPAGALALATKAAPTVEEAPKEDLAELVRNMQRTTGVSEKTQQARQQKVLEAIEKADPAAARRLKKGGAPPEMAALAEEAEKVTKAAAHPRPGESVTTSRSEVDDRRARQLVQTTMAARLAAASKLSVVESQHTAAQAQAASVPVSPAPARSTGLLRVLPKVPRNKVNPAVRQVDGKVTLRRATSAAALPVAAAGQSLVQQQLALARAKAAERKARKDAPATALTGAEAPPELPAATPAAPTGPASSGTEGLPVGAPILVSSSKETGPEGRSSSSKPSSSSTEKAKELAKGAAAGITAAAMAAKILRGGKGSRASSGGLDGIDDDIVVRRVPAPGSTTPVLGGHRKARSTPKAPSATERQDLTEEIVRSVEQRVLEELDRRGLLNRGGLW